mmetsp:Transcript_108511/g.306854  ORF Transcript_108511/g.306854 Transcript_108511/m.306854 type:complete len:299 (-) Transcript_108511:1007-1903(-)
MGHPLLVPAQPAQLLPQLNPQRPHPRGEHVEVEPVGVVPDNHISVELLDLRKERLDQCHLSVVVLDAIPWEHVLCVARRRHRIEAPDRGPRAHPVAELHVRVGRVGADIRVQGASDGHRLMWLLRAPLPSLHAEAQNPQGWACGWHVHPGKQLPVPLGLGREDRRRLDAQLERAERQPCQLLCPRIWLQAQPRRAGNPTCEEQSFKQRRLCTEHVGEVVTGQPWRWHLAACVTQDFQEWQVACTLGHWLLKGIVPPFQFRPQLFDSGAVFAADCVELGFRIHGGLENGTLILQIWHVQ